MRTPSINKSRVVNYLNAGKPLLLDGGMSNQLEDQGFDLNNALWSAHLLVSDPDAIVQAHLHYLNAGAQCLITASYQASLDGLMQVNFPSHSSEADTSENYLSKDQAIDLIFSSVSLAEQAVNQFCLENANALRPFIAASIGPYGAYLADGSEYNGNYGVSDEVISDHHQAQIAILEKTGADMLACETVPSIQEARVLKSLLEKTSMPAWLSFSCMNGKQLNDGSPIEKCVALFSDSSNPIALGVNCTNPKYMVELIERIKSVCPNKFIIVYPNSGEDYDASNKTWHGTATPSECGNASQHWLNAGANIIGGCCRMGPEHIISIKNHLAL